MHQFLPHGLAKPNALLRDIECSNVILYSSVSAYLSISACKKLFYPLTLKFYTIWRGCSNFENLTVTPNMLISLLCAFIYIQRDLVFKEDYLGIICGDFYDTWYN